MNRIIHLLGYACGVASADPGTAEGPLVLQNSAYLAELSQRFDLRWEPLVKSLKGHTETKLTATAAACSDLAKLTARVVREGLFFNVFGGDHSSAIGTWSGVANAKRDEGDIGLIWVDAHMDSHVPETSSTGNIHGMPVACLLGYGSKSLTEIMDSQPKLKPENLCLIGIRSYEPGEAALLKKLNVKVFFMDDINSRGLNAIMAEAIAIVTKNTIGYGISIDIDSMDPEDAPGTGVAEANGIRADDLCAALTLLQNDARLLGAEIVEFDPRRDRDQITEKLIPRIMEAIATNN
jgi:arginase